MIGVARWTEAELPYWIPTLLFCVVLGSSGVAHLARVDFVAQGVVGMGYPPFLMTILGTAKLLGVVTLLAPGRSVLKEWAYAGFTFNSLGAALSHAFAGDASSEVVGPVILLGIAAASYHLRPASRRPATGDQPA